MVVNFYKDLRNSILDHTQNADPEHGLMYDGRITYIEPNIILNHYMNICSFESAILRRTATTSCFKSEFEANWNKLGFLQMTGSPHHSLLDPNLVHFFKSTSYTHN